LHKGKIYFGCTLNKKKSDCKKSTDRDSGSGVFRVEVHVEGEGTV